MENNKNNYPSRKHPRLKIYDYSKDGSYFITICSKNRECIFGEIVNNAKNAYVNLSECGKAAAEQLDALPQIYDYIRIDESVVMPDHIHLILTLHNCNKKYSPQTKRPSVNDIICAYKSVASHAFMKKGYCGKLFQESFYDHIIRNYDEYVMIKNYIRNNPACWKYGYLSEYMRNMYSR